MNEELGVGLRRELRLQVTRLDPGVHMAFAHPDVHLAAGLPLDVRPEELVGQEEDLLIRRARADGRLIEVEVETLDQLDEALAADAERILLDNPTADLVRDALARVGDPTRLEISGGVDLGNVRTFVEAGARVLSVGRLTHSAPALDVSLEVIGIDA